MKVMRTISFESVASAVSELCIEAAYELPEDVTAAVRRAIETESIPRAAEILKQLLENARIAAERRIPICQDTGITVIFITLGKDISIQPPEDNPDATIIDAVQQGVSRGYETGLLRKSVVSEPLQHRKNTQTNTPAVVHLEIVTGDALHLTVMLKGGGCENKSQFRMFNPTESKENVSNWIVEVIRNAGANACPPFVVGVGLGGDFESCCLLSKKALIREIGTSHRDPYYARMEKELMKAANSGGPGPQGLGGDTTVLAVHIETAPCHIASLPAAVNIECHAHRHKSVVL